MKKLLFIATALLLGILCSCSNEDLSPVEPVLKDGVWTGSGEGRSGTIIVKITVENHRITDAVVVSQSESSWRHRRCLCVAGGSRRQHRPDGVHSDSSHCRGREPYPDY